MWEVTDFTGRGCSSSSAVLLKFKWPRLMVRSANNKRNVLELSNSSRTRNKENTMAKNPTYEQAELQLKIFDLRREARLREARDWFNKRYFAKTIEEAMRIAPIGSEASTFFMMVVSYWEQACAYFNHGLLHEDLFFETNGEFFWVWERVKPTIEEGRKRFSNPLFLSNLEKAAKHYETWIEKRVPGHIAAMRHMMEQMALQASKAA